MVHASPMRRWRMVAICFLILNCTLGANFAAYGAMLEEIERSLSATRALASMGLSMVTLALGLLAPLVGNLMRHISIRATIMIGLFMNASGFFLLTQVHDITMFLAVYALVIGPGFTMASIVPCTALVSNWFSTGRGKALGIINIPLGNAIMPLVAASLLISFGLPGALLGNGLVILAMLPLAWLLIDAPEQTESEPLDVRKMASPVPQRAELAMTTAQILRAPRFLILALGIALLSAAGLTMVTHLVPLASDRGLTLDEASLMLSVFGLAGLVGAPLFGWLSDRIGGGLSLAVLALTWIPPWLGLVVAGNDLGVLLALAFVIGICSNGILALFGVVAGEWLGQANIGMVMGLCYFFQIPFMFSTGPLAGAMFERFGSYTPTIFLHVATFAVIGTIFLLYRPMRQAGSMAATHQ